MEYDVNMSLLDAAKNGYAGDAIRFLLMWLEHDFLDCEKDRAEARASLAAIKKINSRNVIRNDAIDALCEKGA